LEQKVHARGTLRPAIVLAVVAIALAGPCALAVSGCGGGDTATARKDALRQQLAALHAQQQAKAKAAGRKCQHQLNDLLTSLRGLRSRLAVGESYRRYLGEVRDLMATYKRIPVNELGAACLVKVGKPSEKAVNRYLDAINVWGACLRKAGCDAFAIAPKVKPKWWQAASLTSTAQKGLEKLQRPK
jgi:hypothetical protein